MSKYPFIPKSLYPAVMFACKLLREGNGFEYSISASAKYYDVDKEELANHVRAREHAGQKGKKRGHYSNYIVEYVVEDSLAECKRFNEPYNTEVVKALNEKNAVDRVIGSLLDYYEYVDYEVRRVE